jgi:hypothetical protein
VKLTKYVPADGPSAIIANSFVRAQRDQAPAPTLQLYLCRACGEEGFIGKKWLTYVQFEGDVHCPICTNVMVPTSAPTK